MKNWWTEWRQVDFETISNHRGRVLDWIDKYRGEPRPGKAESMVFSGTWGKPANIGEENARIAHVQEALKIADSYVAAMNHEEGVWQRPWPRLPYKALTAMRSPEWEKKLIEWPVGETLEGHGKRELKRIGELLQALESSVMDAAVINAPKGMDVFG